MLDRLRRAREHRRDVTFLTTAVHQELPGGSWVVPHRNDRCSRALRLQLGLFGRPAPLEHVSCGRLLAVGDRLHEAGAFDTAVTMAPDWTGTLDELVDTALALAGER